MLAADNKRWLCCDAHAYLGVLICRPNPQGDTGAGSRSARGMRWISQVSPGKHSVASAQLSVMQTCVRSHTSPCWHSLESAHRPRHRPLMHCSPAAQSGGPSAVHA